MGGDRQYLRLCRRGRRGGHARGAPDRPAVGPLPPPSGDGLGTDQHAGPGRSRARHRTRLHLRHRAPAAGQLLPDQPAARPGLRHHVLPPGRGVGARRRGPSPVGLEEVGRSLGVPRRAVFWRVTLPLIGPGLGAAFALVFLETATELTATLVLHPTNIETLATQFWAYQSNISYSQAAPYAGVMVLIAAVPGYVLGRWFDRQPARVAVAGPPVPVVMAPVAS